jgi:uncharacterized membrane protein
MRMTAEHPHLHLKTRVLTTVVILANVLGNFLMSWGLHRHGHVLGGSVAGYLKAFVNPWVSCGVCLLIVWLLSRMALLSWADLSYVLPVTSAGYVLNAVMGRVFLGEHITPARWAGTLLIMAGTALVGSTSIRTTNTPEPELVPEEAAVP